MNHPKPTPVYPKPVREHYAQTVFVKVLAKASEGHEDPMDITLNLLAIAMRDKDSLAIQVYKDVCDLLKEDRQLDGHRSLKDYSPMAGEGIEP